MKPLQTLFIIALAVAIGAVAGLLTSDMRTDGAVAGAVIGAIIGSWLSMRVAMHRHAARAVSQNPQETARQQRLQDNFNAINERAKPGMSREFDDIAALP
ncbi:MAG: hypothetical protein OXE95_08625 [Chloroflexi bacterium]|nr:hypothetical protein [Chloroflexota bacterium]MCY4247623.1 hypothetical protein [Chloroflexota bacterium]